VKLVEDYDAGGFEIRVVVQITEQHARGHGDDPGTRPGEAVEADVVAEPFAGWTAILCGHPPGRRSRGEAARLQHEDLFVAPDAGFEQGGRHARCLPGPCGRPEHGGGVLPQCGDQLRQDGIDWQWREFDGHLENQTAEARRKTARKKYTFPSVRSLFEPQSFDYFCAVWVVDSSGASISRPRTSSSARRNSANASTYSVLIRK